MSQKIIVNAISAVIALGVTAAPVFADKSVPANAPAALDPTQTEKCYGIASSGQNDCSTAKHGCNGEAKIAGDKSEWLNVPTGLCKKIVGGALTPTDSA